MAPAGHGVRAAARAVRDLHHATKAPELATHSRSDELRVIDMWIRRLRPFDAELADQLSQARTHVADPLADAPAGPSAVVHRNLHDKQIPIANDRAGLLDFDLRGGSAVS